MPPAHSAARRRKITLDDIAREAQVSRATVSLVLRESPMVHADTRARVLGQMRRLGYDRAAANPRRPHSRCVALVVNDLSNPFFAEFAAGVDEALAAAGYVALLGSSGESTPRQHVLLGALMQHDPAAIILSPAEGSVAEEIQAIVDPHMPLVVFNRELAGSGRVRESWDFLGLDNRRGAYLATRHLLALGHRRIAFFGGHADSSSCRERRAGYFDALAERGIAPEPRWLIECAPTRLQAAAQADDCCARDPTPTAAVAYNDAVALGLMLGLARRGVRAGADFSVTGFDDIPEASAGAPPLTTIAVDARARGRQAAQLALRRVHGAPDAHLRTIAPVELKIRASSAAPRAGG